MDYTVKKLRTLYGNLKIEIDPIRGRIAFLPFTPSGPTDNYITIPDGKVFYMDVIEVYNTDTAASHTFVVQDDAGNDLSLTYTVPAGEYIKIEFYHGALSGKIHFVPDTYNTLRFKPSGYLDDAE